MSDKGKRKVLIILVIILLLIIIGLCGYIFYKKDSDKTNVNNMQPNNQKVEESDTDNVDVTDKVEAISIDSSMVSKALNNYNKIYVTEKDLYKNSSYSINNISNYDLVATAIVNVDGDQIAYCITEESELKDTISIKELNTILNKYILDKTISIDTIKKIDSKVSNDSLIEYVVNNLGIRIESDGIKLVGPCGGEGLEDFVNKKVVKAEKNDNYLYIYEKQAFAKLDYDETGDKLLANYYKDYNKTSLIEKGLDGTSSYNSDGTVTYKESPKWDLYNTYKYTFKIIDGNYYFQSIELEK